jgi:putative acetyltransferase
MDGLVISIADPRATDIVALLAAHLAWTGATSPPEDTHALDLAGLLDPSVTFCVARLDGELVAIGALKHLAAGHAELKSMHTAAAARGRGIGRAMVDHLVTLAAARGHEVVSLETGSMEAFAPARALYAAAGFVPCGPFGSYRASVNSTFMTRRLVDRRERLDGGSDA